MKALSRIFAFPFHTLLLIAFFILHNYIRYYGLVSENVAWEVFFMIVAIAALVFGTVYWLSRDAGKSALITTLAGIPVLFFGDLKDAVSGFALLSKYVILLPLLLALLVLLFAIVRRRVNTLLHQYLNLFLLFSIAIDIFRMFQHANQEAKNLMVKEETVPVHSNSTNHPDIYYLLFDSYPGSSMLKKYMGFDNSDFVASLQQLGFRVLVSPSSNYNRTVFSMASILNFQYLRDGKDLSPIGPRHYNEALLTTERSSVVKHLQQNGFDFFNLSIFSIGNEKALRHETFLNLPERVMLTYNTLPVRIRNDLSWHLISGPLASPFMKRIVGTESKKFTEQEIGKKAFNQLVIDSVTSIPLHRGDKPKFVYAHFYLPHPPFFFDEKGNSVPMEKAVNDQELKSREDFIAYVKYTNRVILSVTSRIKSLSGNKAVIIVQSDHGYTDFEGRPAEIETVFQNFSAFHFPDGDHSALYDSMSNVNTFPVIFNKYLGTNIPLKKDTSVFLRY